MHSASRWVPLLLLAIASCATATGDTANPLDEQPAETVDGGVIISDPPGSADAAPPVDPSIDAAPPMAMTAPHLVVSEVALAPTEGEFIEIFNGTSSVVALDDVYLSDATEYYLLAGDSGSGPAPSISTYDFVARFPAGSSIAVGGAMTVAIDGDGFFDTFGFDADFCLRGASCTHLDLVLGSASATLTNAGEPIVLLSWDGSNDLVTDLDMVLTGEPTASNPMPDKSGVAVDGPDSGSSPSSYLHDSIAMSYYPSAPGQGTSLKRLAPEMDEQADFGNGYAGHDETSEDLTASWGAPPYSAPTPGSVPATLINP